MDEDVDNEIISRVQWHIEGTLERMGSREYDCAGETSDLDLCLMVPDDWASHAQVIRVLNS